MIINISSLSVYDYIYLKTTFLNHNDSNFQCRYKESKFKDRTDHQAIVRELRRAKGCLVMDDEVIVELDGDYGFKSCLCHPNFQHPDYHSFYEMYRQYKDGYLPFEGCLADQPAKAIEVINYIEGLIAEKEYNDHLREANKGK